MRRGRRFATEFAIVHALATEGSTVRFGFVVSRAVGGAVVRNRVKRRLRAIGRQVIDSVPQGTDLVVRALPGVEQVDWATLHSGMTAVVSRIGRTR